ncbi:glycosyltransferase [Acidocella sp. KAb 2-4]|uniref:glycosyltransferase n=1 Tax=Acidocella sp. KAb 2-4 TaxID=2885158 RepID=UPI001D093E47|nr:glycosyltransferase [Acidocella sp. KAb 2-4]MCB5944210.1 glycosyltransferase [Acidocella sp. KAb 2-4]
MAGVAVPSVESRDLLEHYNEFAGLHRLSPNPFFDEKRYIARYPAVAHAVDRGVFRSGFEHFRLVGVRQGYSPTWFFSSEWYVAKHDISEKDLSFLGFEDAYSHYLAVGLEKNLGAVWLTEAVAKAQLSPDIPRSFQQLHECLTRPGGQAQWLAPIFDAAWWSSKYGVFDHDECVQTYVEGVADKGYSPSATFDEKFYRQRYPDVNSNIEQKSFECGFHHFLLFGMAEEREPISVFDTQYYLAANVGVANECRREGLPPYLHFLKYRRSRALRIGRPFAERDCAEDAGKGIFERKAALLAELGGVDVREIPAPVVSIIIVTQNMYAETMQCIQSIQTGTKCGFEVIIYDNGSTDGVAQIPQRHPHIRYIRSERNLGFTIPANRAAELARGDVVLLVNNDVEVAPGAVDRAVQRLLEDTSIGAIGGRIVRTHGMLQEAGSIVWADGACLGYGRDLSPHHGSVLFERDVDYCSGCFLALRRQDWLALGGFDEAYAPAYYEETDLCLRVWEMGRRVVYDPKIVVWHFEYGSSKLPEDALTLMRRNQKYFRDKHRDYLRQCCAPSVANIEVARMRKAATPRLLFIEDTIPAAGTGQGFVRSAYVAEELRKLMGFTTMVGLNPPPEKKPLWARMPAAANLEIRDDVTQENFADYLRGVEGVYQYIWLSRTHNIRFLRDFLQANPEWRRGVKIIADTEAIGALRMRNQAALLGVEVDLPALLAEELKGIELADHICVVNETDEAAVLQYLASIGVERPVSILGHALSPRARVAGFDEAGQIVLTGSFASPTGPNADALLWFDRAVRPLLGQALPGVEYVVAGHKAAEFCAKAELTGRYTVMSDVKDMASVYAKARVVVAPTRFAGGIPFKVHEAASHGVPVMMSALLAAQLGWEDLVWSEVTGDDAPRQFAETLSRLYTDKKYWAQTAKHQTARIAAECDPAVFAKQLRLIL